MPDQSNLAIEASGLVKSFGGVKAVDGVDLAVGRGSVYGVLGPNGGRQDDDDPDARDPRDLHAADDAPLRTGLAIDLETPHGPARAHLHGEGNDRGALVLGHGAGGSVDAPDLAAATEAAVAAGFTVALIEQPYKVAGKKSQPAASKLDEAWTAVIEELCGSRLDGLPLIVGGRSAGARVACRTAGECEAKAVLCLAFPVHPPGKPEKTRIDELDAIKLPTLVIQGEKDPFGMPGDAPNRQVVRVAGNHGLKADLGAVGDAVSEWLGGLD